MAGSLSKRLSAKMRMASSSHKEWSSGTGNRINPDVEECVAEKNLVEKDPCAIPKTKNTESVNKRQRNWDMESETHKAKISCLTSMSQDASPGTVESSSTSSLDVGDSSSSEWNHQIEQILNSEMKTGGVGSRAVNTKNILQDIEPKSNKSRFFVPGNHSQHQPFLVDDGEERFVQCEEGDKVNDHDYSPSYDKPESEPDEEDIEEGDIIFSDEVVNFVRDLAARAQTSSPSSISQLKMLTQSALQALLRYNNRPVYKLTKPELAAMVLDYMRHGCPPCCPKCERGALRFSNGKKRFGKRYYWCPGSTKDGRHFLGCSFRASRDEVTRVPWKCPSGKEVT